MDKEYPIDLIYGETINNREFVVHNNYWTDGKSMIIKNRGIKHIIPYDATWILVEEPDKTCMYTSCLDLRSIAETLMNSTSFDDYIDHLDLKKELNICWIGYYSENEPIETSFNEDCLRRILGLGQDEDTRIHHIYSDGGVFIELSNERGSTSKVSMPHGTWMMIELVNKSKLVFSRIKDHNKLKDTIIEAVSC